MEPFIDDMALEAANRYLSRHEDLSAAIADIAQRNDLTLEQLKRVIERANRAVFLKLFNNGVADFPIATLTRVLEYMNGMPEETGENECNECTVDEDDEEIDFDLADKRISPLDIFKSDFVDPEPDEKRDKYRTMIIAITCMKKAASDINIAQMKASAEYKKLVSLVAEGLQYFQEKDLMKVILNSPVFAKNKRAAKQVLEEAVKDAKMIVKSKVNTKKAASLNKTASVIKVARYILNHASTSHSFLDIANLMKQEEVDPQQVKEAMHRIYNTHLYDIVIDAAARKMNALDMLKSASRKSVDINQIVESVKNVSESLEKIAQLSEEFNNAFLEARNAAVTPEMKNYLNKVAQGTFKNILRPIRFGAKSGKMWLPFKLLGIAGIGTSIMNAYNETQKTIQDI